MSFNQRNPAWDWRLFAAPSGRLGGTLTGRGGNLVIIDDPLKPAEAMSETKRRTEYEWYDSTLSSCLDSKAEDAIVLIMQQTACGRPSGDVLEKGEGWTT